MTLARAIEKLKSKSFLYLLFYCQNYSFFLLKPNTLSFNIFNHSNSANRFFCPKLFCLSFILNMPIFYFKIHNLFWLTDFLLSKCCHPNYFILEILCSVFFFIQIAFYLFYHFLQVLKCSICHLYKLWN